MTTLKRRVASARASVSRESMDTSRQLVDRTPPAMAKDDIPAGLAGDRPPVERSLLDVEHRGALDQLLLDALRKQLDVDAVAAWDEEDFFELADEGVP